MPSRLLGLGMALLPHPAPVGVLLALAALVGTAGSRVALAWTPWQVYRPELR